MKINFFMPARVMMGKECVIENSGLFGKLGSKALIVTGRESAKLNGSEREIRAALEKEGIPYVIFDETESNPSVENVRKAADIARKHGVDFVIGAGGGSSLDAAKGVAILAANKLSDEDLFSGVFPAKPLPVAAVPTTSGTGSEVTQYAIMTWHTIKNKKSVASQEIIPHLAFLDARYTETLPLNVTVNTALDALSHSLEGFMSVKATELSDLFAVESMRIIGQTLPRLIDASKIGFDTREKLLYASTLGGIVINHTGTTAVHALGYPLTYFRDIDHGRANALLLHGYLEFLSKSCGERVSRALSCMGFCNLNEFGDMVDSLLGQKEHVAPDEIENYVKHTADAKQLSCTIKAPGPADIRVMYKHAFGR